MQKAKWLAVLLTAGFTWGHGAPVGRDVVELAVLVHSGLHAPAEVGLEHLQKRQIINTAAQNSSYFQESQNLPMLSNLKE